MSLPAISCALLPMTSKIEKLPPETEPVAYDNNTSRTLKPKALSTRPKIQEIPGEGANGTAIFRNFREVA